MTLCLFSLLSAVSLAQNTSGEERLKPSNVHCHFSAFLIFLVTYSCHFPPIFCLPSVSKCLTLLIEIQPINNTKVLKAVDCRVKVQVEFMCAALATFMWVLLQPRADIAVMEQWSLQCSSAIVYLFYNLAESALACSCYSLSFSVMSFFFRQRNIIHVFFKKPLCLEPILLLTVGCSPFATLQI